jgi:hypothetical protein
VLFLCHCASVIRQASLDRRLRNASLFIGTRGSTRQTCRKASHARVSQLRIAAKTAIALCVFRKAGPRFNADKAANRTIQV